MSFRNHYTLPVCYTLSACMLFLSACIKDEQAVPRHESGNVKVASVDLGYDYRYQVFYDLTKDTIVSQNVKTDWDLGFECSAEGYRVILNGSKAMFACEKSGQDMASVTDTNGFFANRRCDAPSGMPDSTAIGNWVKDKPVYIIDKGFGLNGLHLGYFKIRFLNVDEKEYTIQYADLSGNNEVNMTVPKDSSYNFSFISVANGGKQVQVEPKKNAWDICFTQYLHVFHDPFTPYLVTGCLLNRTNTTGAADSVLTFENIQFETLKDLKFQERINIIGYNWKAYANGAYTTRSELNYVVRDKNGVYFKLHFIDFYSLSGQKGSPKWEFQRL